MKWLCYIDYSNPNERWNEKCSIVINIYCNIVFVLLILLFVIERLRKNVDEKDMIIKIQFNGI